MRFKKFLRVLSLCLVPALLFGACAERGGNKGTQPDEDPLKDSIHKSNPAEDDTLYILTAAASNSHYFIDELYGVLSAADVKAKACNLM